MAIRRISILVLVRYMSDFDLPSWTSGLYSIVPTDQYYTYEDMEECSSSLLSLLENVLKNELKVSFKMKKYQEVTLQAMSRHKDVIVISPPGSG